MASLSPAQLVESLCRSQLLDRDQQKELPALNAGLRKSKLEAISVLTEADWKKKREGEGGPGAGSGIRLAGGGMWEKD